MSNFTDDEARYLAEQRLGRLATANGAGQPHVTPVGFFYDPATETIGIGGIWLSESKRFGTFKKVKDIRANPRVALVVDDIASFDPWRVRGVEIRGAADVLETGGKQFGEHYDDVWVRITPHRVVSWGLGADADRDYRETAD